MPRCPRTHCIFPMFEMRIMQFIFYYVHVILEKKYPSYSYTDQGGKWWTGVSTDDWYSKGYKLCSATHQFVSTHI